MSDPIDQAEPKLKQTILKQQSGLNAAKRAMMLEDTRRILAKEDAVADAVHRRAFGEDYQPPDEDDMGTIHVGDTKIYHAPPAEQPKTQSNTLQTAVIAAALAAATGMGGYMLANRQPTQQQQLPAPGFEYDSLKIGLGRIEDYVKE